MGDRADTTASPSTPHGGVDRDDDGEVELQMDNALTGECMVDVKVSCHLACALGGRADTPPSPSKPPPSTPPAPSPSTPPTPSPSTPSHANVDSDDDGEVQLQMNNALTGEFIVDVKVTPDATLGQVVARLKEKLCHDGDDAWHACLRKGT